MRFHPRQRGRALATACGIALLTPFTVGPVLAQENGFGQQVEDLRNAVGLGKERPPIDFTERPPLAVPPTYNLPPPVEAGATLGIKDPDVEARRKALADSRRPVPPTDPGAGAAGLNGRAYLVDPPSGFRDPKAVTSAIETDHSPAGAASAKPARKVRKRKPAPDAASTEASK